MKNEKIPSFDEHWLDHEVNTDDRVLDILEAASDYKKNKLLLRVETSLCGGVTNPKTLRLTQKVYAPSPRTQR